MKKIIYLITPILIFLSNSYALDISYQDKYISINKCQNSSVGKGFADVFEFVKASDKYYMIRNHVRCDRFKHKKYFYNDFQTMNMKISSLNVNKDNTYQINNHQKLVYKITKNNIVQKIVTKQNIKWAKEYLKRPHLRPREIKLVKEMLSSNGAIIATKIKDKKLNEIMKNSLYQSFIEASYDGDTKNVQMFLDLGLNPNKEIFLKGKNISALIVARDEKVIELLKNYKTKM